MSAMQQRALTSAARSLRWAMRVPSVTLAPGAVLLVLAGAATVPPTAAASALRRRLARARLR